MSRKEFLKMTSSLSRESGCEDEIREASEHDESGEEVLTGLLFTTLSIISQVTQNIFSQSFITPERVI